MVSIFILFVPIIFAVDACPGGVIPSHKLNDNRFIPGIGLGTWLGYNSEQSEVFSKTEVDMAVRWAIDAGYRHFDTAAIYGTEGQVGNAVGSKINEGVVTREDIFITTKLWNDAHARNAVVPALRESLQRLNMDYVDLYLIHWPISQFKNGVITNIDYLETWKGMIEARDRGFAKSIGVSNFNQTMIERLIAETSVKPAVLQVEVNLNMQQPLLREYCKSVHIAVVGYSPFGSLLYQRAKPDAPPPRVYHIPLVKMANSYNKTVLQVILRYLVNLNVIPIPKSVTKSRLEENIDVFDFQLTQEDMGTLDAYNRDYRTITGKKGWDISPYYPFETYV